MKNCFVTKLKSSVNNDSLPYLNAVIVFNMTKGLSEGNYVTISSPNGTVKVDLISGTGGFTRRKGADVIDNLTTTEITNLENVLIYPSSPSSDNPLKIKISQIDSLKTLEVSQYYSMDIDGLVQCGNLETLTLSPNCIGNVADLSKIPSLKILNVRGANTSIEWKPSGYIDDYYDALFEKGKFGTYTLLVGSGFSSIPHSNKFPTARYGTYTITITSEGWNAVFAAA